MDEKKVYKRLAQHDKRLRELEEMVEALIETNKQLRQELQLRKLQDYQRELDKMFKDRKYPDYQPWIVTCHI